MDDDFCTCHVHGRQPIAFVCNHIVGVPCPGTVGFVSGVSEHEDDLRDAWCEACDEYLQANGGEWTDTVEVPDGIAILCAECYRLREADARSAGRRRLIEGI